MRKSWFIIEMPLFQQSSVGMFHGSADGGEVAEVNQVLHRRTKRFVAQACSVGKGGKIIFDFSSKLNYLSYFESRCYVQLDFVRQFKSKKSCSTTFKSCDVRLGFSSMWKQQLSNIKFVKLNQENNYVRLMLISTKACFLSFFLLKLKSSLTS